MVILQNQPDSHVVIEMYFFVKRLKVLVTPTPTLVFAIVANTARLSHTEHILLVFDNIHHGIIKPAWV